MGTVLSRDKGERAVKLARDSMRSYVADGKRERPGCMKDVFYERVGAAVRLDSTRGRRRVRGSGISYRRDKHLSQAIVDASIEASESCEGTSEVSKCELGSVAVTLCVMSSVKEVGEDAVEECKIGEHGAIVENGRDTGWMLPTVPVERGWSERVVPADEADADEAAYVQVLDDGEIVHDFDIDEARERGLSNLDAVEETVSDAGD